MKNYPLKVSRTLDPAEKALVTVVGLHDRKLADADIDLIQDLQDQKRAQLVGSQTCSGVLTFSPYVFNPFVENTFYIPAFDVLFNGEVLHIAGNLSRDLTRNRVVVPAPSFWTLGSTDEEAAIYVVFLEMWYASLDAESGAGYYVDANNVRYFYPYGCVTPDSSKLTSIPDDSIDPFQSLQTTIRAQLQWAIRVQRVALTYDFNHSRTGLEPGSRPEEVVYGQATNSQRVVLSAMRFQNLGAITGDAGLWRAGDGNVNNSLGTMDGYTYAMPLAVVFQRNTGAFSITTNPFGCADAKIANSGLLRNGVSGRYDRKFADSIFPGDTVDTRRTISLDGFEDDKLIAEGFVDLITGQMRQAIGRGESPGNKAIALGSTLNYSVAMNPTPITNTDTVGQFDGFCNGFSSDDRVFYTTKKVTVAQKSTGTNNTRWVQGDSFTITLPNTGPVFNYVQVQTVADNITDGSKNPVVLLPGQIEVTGLNTQSVTVKIVADVTGKAFDPGMNDLYVSIGVDYPANSGIDLRKVPLSVDGGTLIDGATKKTFPVFGVSDYQVQVQQPALTAQAVWAINNNYSNITFGTRIWVSASGASGVAGTFQGNPVTTFTLNRLMLEGTLNGLYPVRAWDLATGTSYAVAARSINDTQAIISIFGAVDTGSTVMFSFIADATAQTVYNAPVKGILNVTETVLIGNFNSDASLPMDSRVAVLSVKKYTDRNVVVMASSDCTVDGISGDDTLKIIWVQDLATNTFQQVTISTANFAGGIVTLVVPPSVNLELQKFFCVAKLSPAFAPSTELILSEQYVPYQGEGSLGRDYKVIWAEEEALVTTNGTGAAPVVGLRDVYPYNREKPISTSLPAQIGWSDTTLTNAAVASFFDSNYEGKRFSNVEHTFLVPLHTNDFIEPISKDKRKIVRLFSQSGLRGFSKVTPHIGFAIRPPVTRSVLGDNLLATTAPITLYVDNVHGDNTNSGLSAQTAKATIKGALDVLPPVLRHPCSVQLVETGVAYSLTAMAQTDMDVIVMGDGEILPIKQYALGSLAFTIQEAGRLVITAVPTATSPIVIDATGFIGFGDGPVSAFFVDNSRAIFNKLKFVGFRDPAIKGIDSNIEIVDCDLSSNLQGGSFEQGCTVVMLRGSVTLDSANTGFVLSSSEMLASDVNLAVKQGVQAAPFYVAERSSSVTLQNHSSGAGQESGIANDTVIATARLNSSIVCMSTFTSVGKAVIQMNSVLSRTVSVNPFLGGVDADTSSTVTTNL